MSATVNGDLYRPSLAPTGTAFPITMSDPNLPFPEPLVSLYPAPPIETADMAIFVSYDPDMMFPSQVDVREAPHGRRQTPLNRPNNSRARIVGLC